ncbi:MAG: PSD1 and planctomycete cytochrome C domain-containing protein [Planctomycetaceae bacterium]
MWGISSVLLAIATGRFANAGEIEFNRDIRPILSDRCFACHGPDANHREAELRLDVEESAKASVIVPGDAEASELVARIKSDDPDERMPPADSGKSLSPAEQELLKQWIAQGAAYQPFWAYVAPKRHEIPQVDDASWPSNWIDHFILHRLRAEGLTPSPDADRVTLIRRLSFDLIGLPPTPEEVDAFVQDEAEGAYEQLVDRLLDSPHYGERMAVYWLDLVRYADTVGYHGDQEHAISPYRDYVIDAFNRNLPFDQFTREQLAGDLVEGSTIEQKIASGYNRLLQTSHEGGVQPKEYLTIYQADRVRNLSQVWMGATMGCCQCHDHKFDPYTTKDFYSLAAFFADVDEEQHFKSGGDRLPTRREPELELPTPQQAAQLEGLATRIRDVEAMLQSAAGDDARKPLEEQLAGLKKEEAAVRSGVRRSMITVALQTPRTIRLLPRGNWLDDSGPIMQPAVPEFLGPIRSDGDRATRLDLANWLTDPDEGAGLLTARVMANRFWYLCFGTGLAGVLDDFGGQGEPPVHPELLDNLAVEFVESGWDIKHLLKLIVMSRAYRQSSVDSPELRARDPLNRLYARQSRFRLSAEMVRDTALAVSGLLVTGCGGDSVRPYQPAGYYRHLNFPTREYAHHTDERQWRRGVYVHWQRQYLHPMLKAFDAPSREECTAQRPRSNTPLAALVLLNDPSFIEAARVFAEHALTETGDTDDVRQDFLFRRALSRNPDEHERRLLHDLLDESREQYRTQPDAARQLVRVGLHESETADVVELAAWTCVARAVLNLNETITRN